MAKRDGYPFAARRELSQLRAAVEFSGNLSNSAKSLGVLGCIMHATHSAASTPAMMRKDEAGC